MANSPDTSGNLAVDAHFKSHESLWDNTRGERFVEALHRAGSILPPGIDLMLAWKAANYTHGAPLLLVSGVSRFFAELTNNPAIDLVWDRLIAAVQKQIAPVDLPMDKTRQIQLRLEMAAAASKEGERNCARSALCFGAHNA